MTAVHLDLSQLIADPAHAGIQRAERELIRHWPGPAPLIPCRFDPRHGEFRELPESLLQTLIAGGPAGEAGRRESEPHLHAGPRLPPGARLLCFELFNDPARSQAYIDLGDAPKDIEIAWFVHDFLPWLRPDWFAPGGPRGLMPYLRALRTVPRVAFNSEQTRLGYERVVRRTAPGPVIPLGGDGLSLERQCFASKRRGFAFLGTLEPRKNGALVLRAFERLWQEGGDASLIVIGKSHEHGLEEQAILARLAGEPRLRVLTHAPDSAVRAALREARALIFPSEGEGYGLPPVEALHAGIPVIVAASLPSLHGLPPSGQVRLDPVSDATLLDALHRLIDDEQAQWLWDEAAGLHVPTWRGFAEGVAAWMQARDG